MSDSAAAEATSPRELRRFLETAVCADPKNNKIMMMKGLVLALLCITVPASATSADEMNLLLVILEVLDEESFKRGAQLDVWRRQCMET